MLTNGSSIISMIHGAAAYGYVHAADAEAATATLRQHLVNHNLVPNNCLLEAQVEEQPLTPDVDDKWVVCTVEMQGADPVTFSILALRQDFTRRCPKCGFELPDAQCWACGDWQELVDFNLERQAVVNLADFARR